MYQKPKTIQTLLPARSAGHPEKALTFCGQNRHKSFGDGRRSCPAPRVEDRIHHLRQQAEGLGERVGTPGPLVLQLQVEAPVGAQGQPGP